MKEQNYPTSVASLATWQKQQGTTREEARRRLVQYVILASISSSTAMRSRIAFKGGNALRFIHGNPRSTLDLDFSANADFPDSAVEIKLLIDAALKGGERQYQVKARCQSIQRKPPGLGKTRPTYHIKVCYQLTGDRYYHNIDERLTTGHAIPEVVVVEISLNEVLCETENEALEPGTNRLRVCSLDDIIAEKLRALLQQVIRGRNRPQDVFDIASMIRKHPDKISIEKISSFLIRKSEAREIVATKGAFNESVRDQALTSYDDEIRGFTTQFIPFEEAWNEVLGLVARLMIPE